MRRALAILTSYALLLAVASAQVSMSGRITNNGRTRATAPPAATATFLATCNFDDGIICADLTVDKSPSATVDVFTPSAGAPCPAKSGTKVIRFMTGDQEVARVVDDGEGNNLPKTDAAGVYVSGWLCVPTETMNKIHNGASGQVKFTFQRQDPTGSFEIIGTGPEFSGCTTNEICVYKDSGITPITGTNTKQTLGDGKWHFVVTRVKRHPGLGCLSVWMDHSLVIDNVCDSGFGTDGSDNWVMWWGINTSQGASSYPLTVYMDDITAANGYPR